MHITWSKDGREIRTGGNFSISFVANTAHLRVLRVGKGDSGQYTCQASNEAGKHFCSAQLSVKGIKSPVCVFFFLGKAMSLLLSLVFPVWKYIESSFPESRNIPRGELLSYCMTIEACVPAKSLRGNTPL